MSNSTGTIYVDEKIVGYFKYNGTVDLADTTVFETKDDVWSVENRGKQNSIECKCGLGGTLCILHTEYGGGFWWEGKVCLNCKAIKEDSRDPFEFEGKFTDGGYI